MTLPLLSEISSLKRVLFIACAALVWTGCSREESVEVAQIPDQVEFNAHVRPILVQNCTACHGGVKTAGGVSFIYREEVLSRSDSGKMVVTPGAPEASEMFQFRQPTSWNVCRRSLMATRCRRGK